MQGEAASADGEAAASYPDLANVINEVATPSNRFSMSTKQLFLEEDAN